MAENYTQEYESRWNGIYEEVQVRIWRKEQEMRIFYKNSDLDKVWLGWVSMMARMFMPPRKKYIPEEHIIRLVNDLLACGRINSIEVMIDGGQGMAYHPEWP